jgi:hypothetical protein
VGKEGTEGGTGSIKKEENGEPSDSEYGSSEGSSSGFSQSGSSFEEDIKDVKNVSCMKLRTLHLKL